MAHRAFLVPILLATLAAPAWAQSMAQCRAALPAPAAERLKLCEAHAGCRSVVRIVDSCPALQTFLQLLGNNGPRVDDGALRRTLVEAGVPPAGLASCTTDFNRALCRNFLNLEDASGETAAGPSRTAQFDAGLRRLVEQSERARVPADAHRQAELKLEACGLARPGPERDAPCREAIQAVQACELSRQEWAQRREVLLVDAQRLGLAAAQQTLRSLEIAPCPRTLPGSNLTPQEALVAAAVDVPEPATAANPPVRGAAAGPASPSSTGSTPAASPTATAASLTATTAAAAANTNAAMPPASRTAPAEAAAGTDCRGSLRRMEDRFEGIQRRRPAEASRLAVQQVEIFMLTEQMGLLERLCRGQREYEFLRPTQERLARALQGCRETAANPVNDCVPRVAW